MVPHLASRSPSKLVSVSHMSSPFLESLLPHFLAHDISGSSDLFLPQLWNQLLVTLVPFSGEKYSEAKIWTLGTLTHCYWYYHYSKPSSMNRYKEYMYIHILDRKEGSERGRKDIFSSLFNYKYTENHQFTPVSPIVSNTCIPFSKVRNLTPFILNIFTYSFK